MDGRTAATAATRTDFFPMRAGDVHRRGRDEHKLGRGRATSRCRPQPQPTSPPPLPLGELSHKSLKTRLQYPPLGSCSFPPLKHLQSGLDVQEPFRGSWAIPQSDLPLDFGDQPSGVEFREPGCPGGNVQEKDDAGPSLGAPFVLTRVSTRVRAGAAAFEVGSRHP